MIPATVLEDSQQCSKVFFPECKIFGVDDQKFAHC